MSLTNKIEKATSTIDTLMEQYTGFLLATVDKANRMTNVILELSNDDLAGWLMLKPLDERMAHLESHRLQGEALNAAVAVLESLQEEGSPPLNKVDTRSVNEKLADQYREMKFDENGKIVVIDLPRPEPDPIDENP